MIHGFLNVDKPAGITSHDVVSRLRRLAAQKRVGHGGTLDPAATGVLPVALGEATRLVDYLVEGRKRYTAVIKLGVATATDDAEGAIISEQPVPALVPAGLQSALSTFVGVIEQVPPMYSAIQVGGKRLYDLARQGASLELAPRPVEIDRLDLLDWQPPYLTVDVVCGKGTYIRAIARDLGRLLACGAHLHALRRTAVGPLTLATAIALDELEAAPLSLARHLLPPEVAVADLPRVDVDDAVAQRVRHGLPVDLPRAEGTLLRLHAGGTLLALVRYDGSAWRPFKVFAWR